MNVKKNDEQQSFLDVVEWIKNEFVKMSCSGDQVPLCAVAKTSTGKTVGRHCECVAVSQHSQTLGVMSTVVVSSQKGQTHTHNGILSTLNGLLSSL